MASLPNQWKQWVLKALLNQTTPMSILETLLDNGFTFEQAQNALGKNLPANLTCQQDNAFYARLAKPLLLQNAKMQSVEQQKVQLYRLEDLLSAQECENLVAISMPQFRPSTVTNTNNDGFRTSRTCDASYIEDPLVKRVEQRIIDVMGLGVGENEVMQVQHYAEGQEFKAHTDYFEPGSQEYQQYAKHRGQRTWTFMVYLNDGCEGGETEFKQLGVSFQPKRGSALIWNNLYPDGTPNPDTLHQAHPVTRGEKAIITKWFREKNQ